MFEDNVAAEFLGQRGENLTENIGVLFDDAGERDDEDDSSVAVFQGVAEGEEERRKCFPATGRDGEGEEAAVVFRRVDAVQADGFAGLVDGIVAGRVEFFLHVGFEGLEHLAEDVVRPRLAEFGFLRLHEGFGGEEVGIDEAGEEEAEETGESVVAGIGTGERSHGENFIERNTCGFSVGSPFVDLFRKAFMEEIGSVGETGMMTGNEVAEEIPEWLHLWSRVSEGGPGGGVVFFFEGDPVLSAVWGSTLDFR